MEEKWYAVWGFASTGSEVGILEEFPTREAALACARDFERRNDNPACGCWVRRADAQED